MSSFAWSQTKQITIPKLILAFVIPCGLITLEFLSGHAAPGNIGLPVLVAYPHPGIFLPVADVVCRYNPSFPGGKADGDQFQGEKLP